MRKMIAIILVLLCFGYLIIKDRERRRKTPYPIYTFDTMIDEESRAKVRIKGESIWYVFDSYGKDISGISIDYLDDNVYILFYKKADSYMVLIFNVVGKTITYYFEPVIWSKVWPDAPHLDVSTISENKFQIQYGDKVVIKTVDAFETKENSL